MIIKKLILGSASPARQRILREMGYSFEVVPSEIDERTVRCDDPRELALALAEVKASVLVERVREPAVILTADSIVLVEGQLREKPRDESECRHFLESYAAHPATVVTAVCAVNTKTRECVCGAEEATIHFRPIPAPVIEELLRERSVLHASGGFIAEHPLLRPYINRLEGSIETIMGLPVELTRQLVAEVQL